MNSHENEIFTTNTSNFILSQGRWDENISWEFIVSVDLPPKELCTAVCGIVTFEKQLILVKNKRGWELPAGKIEEETIEEALIREMKEETTAVIENFSLFGYKKLTAKYPTFRDEKRQTFYPFPHSYIIFFRAEVKEFLDTPIAGDIEELKLATHTEAEKLLKPGQQYSGVVNYLYEKNMIAL